MYNMCCRYRPIRPHTLQFGHIIYYLQQKKSDLFAQVAKNPRYDTAPSHRTSPKAFHANGAKGIVQVTRQLFFAHVTLALQFYLARTSLDMNRTCIVEKSSKNCPWQSWVNKHDRLNCIYATHVYSVFKSSLKIMTI